MFNGAKKFGPKEFDRTMEASGGANNAYTSENITAYTDWFPSSALEIIFELESDRIAHLNFDSSMIESERGVILSERSTGLENNPMEELWQEVQATAFIAHPYMWPVIGWESDIKNWTKQDLENYFHTYYAPNNCVVVISGDVKFDDVKMFAEKYFGSIPSGPEPRKVHTIEPTQTGERRVFVQREVPTPYLMITYHVPQSGSEDYYALDLLNSILSQGRSSRLYSSLVEDSQLALEADSYYGDAFDPTLFYLLGVCNDGIKASELEKAMLNEIQKIIDEGINLRAAGVGQRRGQIGGQRVPHRLFGRAAVQHVVVDDPAALRLRAPAPAEDLDLEAVVLHVDARGEDQAAWRDAAQRHRLGARGQGGVLDVAAGVGPALAEPRVDEAHQLGGVSLRCDPLGR